MGYKYAKWTDRVADKLKMGKENWIHVGIAVGIAVLISAIVLITQAPTKGEYNTDMVRIDNDLVTMGAYVADMDTELTDLTGDVGELETGATTRQEQLDGVSNTVALHTGSINSTKKRVTTIEGKITTIEDELATVGSPPEGYLTGTYGNYTLHAKASDAGNFTANIHLVYSTPIAVGNGTTYNQAVQAFCDDIDWVAANTTKYACTVIYTGTAWGVSQVWFNIGTFSLEEGTEKAISIKFGGLNSTYEPDFAYVEVYPALK